MTTKQLLTLQRIAMRILLISPPCVHQPAVIRDYTLFFPLGLMYIQAFLKAQGYRETQICLLPRAFQKFIKDIIEEKTPDFIGITSVSDNYYHAVHIATMIKSMRPHVRIAFGGIHATCVGEKILNAVPAVDYIVQGEGEYAVKELLDCVRDNREPHEVKGVSFRNHNNQLVTTPLRERITRLDDLPFPCYDSLDQNILTHTNHFCILASRGCLFNCSFCSCAHFYQHKWIHRSPRNIIEEIYFLKKRFHPQKISFNDAFVTADRDYACSLFSALAKENFEIEFRLQTRPDFVDDELLNIMYHAGVRLIKYGIESGSVRLLKNARRTLSDDALAKQKDTICRTRTAGIETQVNFMVGWPGERIGDLWKTLQLLYACRPTTIMVNSIMVYPGTALFKRVKNEGLLDDQYWVEPNRPPKYAHVSQGIIGRITTGIYEIIVLLLFSFQSKSFSDIKAAWGLKKIDISHNVLRAVKK